MITEALILRLPDLHAAIITRTAFESLIGERNQEVRRVYLRILLVR